MFQHTEKKLWAIKWAVPGSLINAPILCPRMQPHEHLTEWASQARTHTTGEKVSQMLSRTKEITEKARILMERWDQFRLANKKVSNIFYPQHWIDWLPRQSTNPQQENRTVIPRIPSVTTWWKAIKSFIELEIKLTVPVPLILIHCWANQLMR